MHPQGSGSLLPDVVFELERHVSQAGWDQAPRLFALVATDEIISAEPDLADSLGLVAGGVTPVEQDEFDVDSPLDEALAQLAWPDKVLGAALSVERVLLPPDAESDLPEGEDADRLADAVAADPRSEDVRIVVAVNRDGDTACGLRLRGHEQDLLTGPDLVPQLARALHATFE